MKLFIDTSAFLVLFIDKEKFHREAVKKYQEYKAYKATFITSDYILDELYTRLITHFGKNTTETKINQIDNLIINGQLQVLSVNGVVFKEATRVLLKYSEHKVSFTDATTYVLCKDLKIDEIFTLDDDFKKMRIKTSGIV